MKSHRRAALPALIAGRPVAGGSEVSVDELVEILKNDIEMSAQSLRGVKKRYDVGGDLGFEDAQGWLVHALDVIRYWERRK